MDFSRRVVAAGVVYALLCAPAGCVEQRGTKAGPQTAVKPPPVVTPKPTFDKPFRIGMIGLDTSHVVAFTRIFNKAKKPDPLAKFRVVAAYKGGSPDIPSSADRLEKFTKTLREEYRVEICETIEGLCTKVDGILLESVDGRPHLAQARPVIKARLPLFIDKPMAGSLRDVIEIFRLAEEANVPCWSSSSLRFWPPVAEVKAKLAGKRVKKVVAWSPCSHEEHHPDLFWYGVHGCEILFTLMGPGCQSVVRQKGKDVVTGKWADGRIGVFDPDHKPKAKGKRAGYGAEVITDDGTFVTGPKGDYYGALMKAVARFFETCKPPVDPAETTNMFAFMEAADESKRQGCKEVKIADVIAKARTAPAK